MLLDTRFPQPHLKHTVTKNAFQNYGSVDKAARDWAVVVMKLMNICYLRILPMIPACVPVSDGTWTPSQHEVATI